MSIISRSEVDTIRFCKTTIAKYQLTRPQDNVWYSFEAAELQKKNLSHRMAVCSYQTIDTVSGVVDLQLFDRVQQFRRKDRRRQVRRYILSYIPRFPFHTEHIFATFREVWKLVVSNGISNDIVINIRQIALIIFAHHVTPFYSFLEIHIMYFQKAVKWLVCIQSWAERLSAFFCEFRMISVLSNEKICFPLREFFH